VSRYTSLVLPAVLSFLVAALPAQASNLLVNPGLENADSQGWSYWGLGWRLGSGADARSGSWGLVDDVLTTDGAGESWRAFY